MGGIVVKQLILALSIVLVVGLITIPVMAWGHHGAGGGHHVMGHWGGDAAYR